MFKVMFAAYEKKPNIIIIILKENVNFSITGGTDAIYTITYKYNAVTHTFCKTYPVNLMLYM